MRMRCLVVLTLSLAPLSPATAQSLDPTRPPEAASVAAPAASAHVANAPVAAMRLQSVQVPREGRASALVDGRLMFVGDRLGLSTVSAIDADGIRLRNPKGAVERLPLLDAQVVKQPVLASIDAPSPAAGLLAKGK